jgi:antitoxin VapB
VTINIDNPQADQLTRQFAKIANVGITEAVILAMNEAIARRRLAETPAETAARIRAKYGVVLSDQAKVPLPKAAWDELVGDDLSQ